MIVPHGARPDRRYGLHEIPALRKELGLGNVPHLSEHLVGLIGWIQSNKRWDILTCMWEEIEQEIRGRTGESWDLLAAGTLRDPNHRADYEKYRGDVDLLASPDLVVQQGDRIRVIAPRARLAEVAGYLGDSERGPGDLNPVGLFVGLALGVLVGLVAVPLPGGAEFALGVAAGPLVVGLVLGRAARTGPIVWSIPYTASSALQQLGALVFLAAAGSRAGSEVAAALSSPHGLRILLAGLLVAATAALGMLLIARLWRVGGARMAGMVAGAQTQPAVLAFARERARDVERVSLGYALVFPAAMLVKILAVQVLVIV